MNRFKTLTISAVCTFLLLVAPAFADGLRAQVRSSTVAQNTPFQLVLSGDTSDLTAAPDLTPLAADFDILGTSQSRQTQIINGARTDRLKWTVTLAAKRKGRLTIPVVHAGSATSDALHLDVVDAATLPVARVPGAPELTLSVPEGTHYVHQEIPITLRITSRENLQSGDLVLPQSAEFTLTQSGADRTTQVAGPQGPRTVLERTYLLRPQKDGAVILPPFTLNAVLHDPNARNPFGNSAFQSLLGRSGRDPFAGLFQTGKQIAVRSTPVTLNIKANPAGADTWFLPAKDVQITAKWQPEEAEFKTGEAVKRTVQVIALGATDTQLPDLKVADAEGLRVYLDNTQNRTVDTQNGSAAIREFSYSVVPTKGGQVTFPEIQLHWFDTGSETQKTAVLPAQVLTVQGSVQAKIAPSEPVVEQGTQAATQPSKTGMFWAIGVAALLSLCLLGVWLGRVYQRLRSGESTPTPADHQKAALQQARKALREGDMRALHAAVQMWMTQAQVTSYDEIVTKLSALAQPWNAFEAMLFGEGREMDHKSGAAVLEALEQADGARRSRGFRATRAAPALQPLYRIGSAAR